MEKKPNEVTNQERIRRIHEETGLSFDKLAKITGFNRNTLAAWAKGRRRANDINTSAFEERISAYLNGGCEYINRTAYRDQFRQDVEDIISTEDQVNAIMTAFDDIPIAFVKNSENSKTEDKGRKLNGEDEDKEQI